MYDSCPICHNDWDPIEKELQCCRYCNYQESYSIEMDWELIDKRLKINEELQIRAEELSIIIEDKELKLYFINAGIETKLHERESKREKKERIFKILGRIYVILFIPLLILALNFWGKNQTKRDIQKKNEWYRVNKGWVDPVKVVYDKQRKSYDSLFFEPFPEQFNDSLFWARQSKLDSIKPNNDFLFE